VDCGSFLVSFFPSVHPKEVRRLEKIVLMGRHYSGVGQFLLEFLLIWGKEIDKTPCGIELNQGEVNSFDSGARGEVSFQRGDEDWRFRQLRGK